MLAYFHFKRLYLILLFGGFMQLNAAPYGSWDSPITPQSLVKGAKRFLQLEVEGDELYWLEMRPEEQGRGVFIRASDQQEMIPSTFNIRTTVHEYGGKCALIHKDFLYFTNFADQHLYRVRAGEDPQCIVNHTGYRFADFDITPDGNTLFAIVEDHNIEGECENAIGKVDLKSGKLTKIAQGHDFYAFCRLDHEGKRLAFIAWDHPHMMWDQTFLRVMNLETGKVDKIAGGTDISVSEPHWTPCGHLLYVSDQDDFWQIYDETGQKIIDRQADFTFPLWRLGVCRTTFVKKDGISYLVTVATDKGRDSLIVLNWGTKEITTFDDHPFTFISEIKSYQDGIVMIAATPTSESAIYTVDISSGNYCKLNSERDKKSIDESYISYPELLEFPTEGGKTAYGFFYPPKNPQYTVKDSAEKPPLIVMSHGGPTAHVPPVFSKTIQFWTTRGFAVANINYGGSSGYGRKYRNRLRTSWGIVDVDDCCNAALYLAKKGVIDGHRMGIEGGSAGGYTTLAALTFRKVFQAGISYFGVSDLSLMTQETHKFESRYLDSLIGPYPKEKQRYKDRSPLYHIDQLSTPTLLLQGDEDRIVPPNQAELMYQALLQKKIPTAYILFKGEQHGFRQAQTIIQAIEAQLQFYQKIFSIPVGKTSYPLVIQNLSNN